MAHRLPGVRGDPRNGQVTPCPQPFIAVTLLGAADPGTVVPLSLPPPQASPSHHARAKALSLSQCLGAGLHLLEDYRGCPIINHLHAQTRRWRG